MVSTIKVMIDGLPPLKQTTAREPALEGISWQHFIVTNTITENAVVHVLLEIPGDETVEGQVECLLVYHPGKTNVWKCPKCACNVFNAPVLLRKHCKIQHPRVQIMFRCGTCDFKSENSRSVGTHMRMCKGMPEKKAYNCMIDECAKSFYSFQGLQVHRSRSHRKECNETLPEKRIFRWGEAELNDMAKAEIELNDRGVTVRMINIHRQWKFSHRTVQAIGKMRSSNARYEEIRTEMRRKKQVEREREMIAIPIDNGINVNGERESETHVLETWSYEMVNADFVEIILDKDQSEPVASIAESQTEGDMSDEWIHELLNSNAVNIILESDGNAVNEVEATGKADAHNEIIRFINEHGCEDPISQLVLIYVKRERSWEEIKKEMVVDLPKDRKSGKTNNRWKKGPMPANRREQENKEMEKVYKGSTSVEKRQMCHNSRNY